MATGALDSTALFKDHAQGVAGTVSGLVVLLLAAKILGRLEPHDRPPKKIVFALFNGEAYDYIGSSRFAVDLSEGKFPSWTKCVGADIEQRLCE
jgi:nicastrin